MTPLELHHWFLQKRVEQENQRSREQERMERLKEIREREYYWRPL